MNETVMESTTKHMRRRVGTASLCPRGNAGCAYGSMVIVYLVELVYE